MPRKTPNIQNSKDEASVLSALISRRGAIIVAIIAATGTILAAFIAKRLGEPQVPSQRSEPYKYVGKVFDKATGNNIREAKISLEGSGDVPAVAFTDSEGVFSFPLRDPRREIHLRIEEAGYEKFDLGVVPSNIDGIQVIRLTPAPSTSPTQPIHVSANQRGQPTAPQSTGTPNLKAGPPIEQERTSVVTGTVVDADTGRPVSGARVNVDGYSGEAVNTKADGTFTLAAHTNGGQMFWLRAAKEGYVLKQVIHQGGSQAATIRLSKEH